MVLDFTASVFLLCGATKFSRLYCGFSFGLVAFIHLPFSRGCLRNRFSFWDLFPANFTAMFFCVFV